MDADKNLRVCIAAYEDDEGPLASMLDELLERLDES